jgi:Ser/Thr protein kinase RdoA (MazF antagonist)
MRRSLGTPAADWLEGAIAAAAAAGVRYPFQLPQHTDSVAAITSCVALGLRALHRSHFVHRDIKPDNVMVTAHRPAAQVWL